MRLAFNDIKKTISRRGGEPRLIPYLLPIPSSSTRRAPSVGASGWTPSGDNGVGASGWTPPSAGRPLTGTRPLPGGRSTSAPPTRELDALIALYESYVGRPRSAWPDDRAALLVGDYRLARCLETILADWYVWQSPAWPETETGADVTAAALAARDITTPSQLRLALYDFVSASSGGFLPANTRDAALDAFASELAIPRAMLENLLYLDSDARAVLARLTPAAPTAVQLATRYNQRVLEAVLTNSSHVEWLLTPEYVAATGEPLGALVKRICFLARRMGVQYDVAYAATDTESATGTPSLPRVAERRAPYSIEQENGTTEDTEDTEDTEGTEDTEEHRGEREVTTESREGIPAESATGFALTHFDIPAESATASDSLRPASVGALPAAPAPGENQIPAESATAPIGLAAGPQPANPRPTHGSPLVATPHFAAPLSPQGEGVGGEVPLPAESATATNRQDASATTTNPPFPSVPSVVESPSFPPFPSVSSVPSVVNPSSPLAVTLYGPQEMTGAPNQYGERLARLCRALLGYRRAAEKPGRSTLAGAGLTGSARVYLHGRPYTFELDARLLKLIGSADDGNGAPDDGDATESATPQFDSALEQRLYEQFAALERDGEARGWRLEREPEPILAGTTILVPDFALTRGAQRVYLEIAGYWRPEYRERKARKLAAVRGRVALALAAPLAARAELAPLERDFPILWYKDTVSAESLLALLDRAYNDFEVRLARLDLAAISAEVEARGCIPPVEGMALVRCYSRAESARALDLLRHHAADTGTPAPEWLDGIGLCSPAWLAHLLGGIRHALEVADGQRLSMSEVSATVAALFDGQNALTIPESAAEMLARRAGLHIMRTSIFDAEVCLQDAPASVGASGWTPAAGEETSGSPLPAGRGVGGEDPTPPLAPTTQPRRRPRRTHTRTHSYTTQSIFPPEQPGPDQPVPDTPTRAP